MDDKEKLKFLRQMGLSVARTDVEEFDKKKDKKDTRVDISELRHVARIFNVHPSGNKKSETLKEFLDKEGE